ncbi:hypothetical protein BYT27DRAFT_7133062 [Phlegmacium glaucopus]|nr:hypothetical protein BYT27DRAFT_7133062 [Phlegmacium glaucopus]
MSWQKAADIGSAPIPKPLEQLCSLSPHMIFQVLVARYVSVGTLAVFFWEILNNIFNDYKLLTEHRIRFPTVVYFISRVSCLGFIISVVILETTPIARCDLLEKGLEIIYPFTVISSSLLFFFRTRAVFDRDPWVVAFFACSWLAVVAGYLTFIIKVVQVKAIPGTCQVLAHFRSFATAATIITLINDTLVFLAITWRLFSNSYGRRTIGDNIRVFLFGDYLPVFSKAMLQAGQLYYLIVVTVNLITVIMLCTHSVPAILQVIFVVPNVVMMNIMTCRVFRNTMLGTFTEVEISSSAILGRLSTAC